MKPFTVKQKILSIFISFLEFLFNSQLLILPFNYLSKILQTILLSNGSFYSGQNSMFKGLSVAFIADGNRRWNKKKSLEKKNLPSAPLVEEQKVRVGMKKITEVMKFAFFHNIKEVSFYCFAIKNFGRPKIEVDGIMNYIKKYGIVEKSVPFKFKIYGNLELLETDVRDVFLDLQDETKDVKGLVMNIFFSYSSSDDDKNENRYSNKVDLLVRTGGNKRLSDFLVRQVADGTAVEFINPLWPEFSLVHLWLVLYKLVLEEKYLKV